MPTDRSTDSQHLTLSALVERLGPSIIHLIGGTVDVDRRYVAAVVLVDRLQQRSFRGGDLVLGVGVEPDADPALQLVREAGRAGAAAVALKAEHQLSDPLLSAAADAGIPLGVVHPEVDWGELYSVARAAIATGAADLRPAVSVATDLFGVANVIARTAGGAVLLQDHRFNVLAYSTLEHEIDDDRRNVILHRSLTEDVAAHNRAESVIDRIRAAEDVVRFPANESLGRRARAVITVRAGHEVLGWITVIEGDVPLTTDAEGALRSAAPIVALYLTRQRATRDAARERRREMLYDLLQRGSGSRWVASELGIDERVRCAVVAFACTDGPAQGAVERASALEFIARSCELLRPEALCLTTATAAYALVVGHDAEDLPLRKFANDVVDRARTSMRVAVRAAIGTTVPTLEAAAASRTEADRVLSVLGEGAGNSVADINAVRHLVVLAELRDVARERPSLTSGKIDVLRRHDARSGTAYVRTVQAYVDHFGDISACAAALNIHPNTLRYRMKRAVELSGIDLNDPLERLVVALQIHLGSAELIAGAQPVDLEEERRARSL